MDEKHEKIAQVALIAAGLITYGVSTYLIAKIVVALNALNTAPQQPKKLPEARAIESGHAWLSSHGFVNSHNVRWQVSAGCFQHSVGGAYDDALRRDSPSKDV
jgi:hypothetical protein